MRAAARTRHGRDNDGTHGPSVSPDGNVCVIAHSHTTGWSPLLFLQWVIQSFRTALPSEFDRSFTEDSLSTLVREALMVASRSLQFSTSFSPPSRNDAELTALWSVGPFCVLAQCGSPQAFRWRGTGLQRLSQEQDVINPMLLPEAGLTGAEVAELNLAPQALVQGASLRRSERALVRVLPALRHETLLLCTARMSEVLSLAELQRVFERHVRASVDTLADALLHAVTASGSTLDVSFIVLRNEHQDEGRMSRTYASVTDDGQRFTHVPTMLDSRRAEIVALVRDRESPAAAWEALASHGFVPMDWIDSAERVFAGRTAVRECAHTDIGEILRSLQGEGSRVEQVVRLASMTQVHFQKVHPAPSSLEECVAVACNLERMTTAEATIREAASTLGLMGGASGDRVIWRLGSNAGTMAYSPLPLAGLARGFRDHDNSNAPRGGLMLPESVTTTRATECLAAMGCPVVAVSSAGRELALADGDWSQRSTSSTR